MEIYTAAAALGGLAHEGRLAIYRMLVVAGPQGLPVGSIARKLKMPGATLSFHLAQLKQAGLVLTRRDGRELIQTADFTRMTALVDYLTENCCAGDATACAPAACKPPPRKVAVKRKRP